MNEVSTKIWRDLAIAGTISCQLYGNCYSNFLISQGSHKNCNLLQVKYGVLRVALGSVALVYLKSILAFLFIQLTIFLFQNLALKRQCYNSLSMAVVPSFYLDIGLIKKNFQYTLSMAATSFSGSFMLSLDRLLLSTLGGPTELAKYSAAITLANVLILPVVPVYKVFFPVVNSLFKDGKVLAAKNECFKFLEYLVVVQFTVGVSAVMISQILFSIWLGKTHSQIADIFLPLCFGIISAGLLWIPAAYLQAIGKATVHLKAMVSAIIISLIVAPYFIKKFGAKGASVVWCVHGVVGLTYEIYTISGARILGFFSSLYVVLKKGIILSFIQIAINKIVFLNISSDYNRVALISGLTLVTSVFGLRWVNKSYESN
jgi:O-antigen/teichoic acid export membrane protein